MCGKFQFSILISMDIQCYVHTECGKRGVCNMEINFVMLSLKDYFIIS